MLTLLLLAVAAMGQTAAAAPVPVPAAQAEQVPAAGYSYNSEGRRDPFLSLVGRGSDPSEGARAAGLPGLLINEVAVKGVVRGAAGYIAMIQAPDNKTYIVRSGDRLLDGAVKTIDQGGVIFSQDVSDPLSALKQREVPKRVRATEGRD